MVEVIVYEPEDGKSRLKGLENVDFHPEFELFIERMRLEHEEELNKLEIAQRRRLERLKLRLEAKSTLEAKLKLEAKSILEAKLKLEVQSRLELDKPKLERNKIPLDILEKAGIILIKNLMSQGLSINTVAEQLKLDMPYMNELVAKIHTEG